MEGIIWILIISLLILSVSFLSLSHTQEEPSPATPNESTFQRVNAVEGILTVNDTSFRTYNIGTLLLDDCIRIRFYESYLTPIRITDIYYQDKSLYGYAPPGIWRDKCDYAVTVLKQLVNEGALSPTLVEEVEEIIMEVDTLNEHIQKGHLVYRKEEFTWVF